MLCVFCPRDRPRAGSLRCSGVDVCEACAQAPFASVDRQHGVLPVVVVAHGRMNQDGLWEYMVRTKMPLSGAPMRWRCTRQRMRHRVLKLFVHELEIGDPLFDDRVFISTETPEETQRVMDEEGVQSAILALVAGMEDASDHLTLAGGELTWCLSSRTALDARAWASCQLEFAVLSHWLLTSDRPPGVGPTSDTLLP